MTRTELFQQFAAADLFAIPVDDDIDGRDTKGMRFVGDTTEFIAAAKALGSRCVFVASRILVAGDFVCGDDGGSRRGETTTAEQGAVDLLAVRPALAEFQPRLDQHCGYRAWVRVDSTREPQRILPS